MFFNYSSIRLKNYSTATNIYKTPTIRYCSGSLEYEEQKDCRELCGRCQALGKKRQGRQKKAMLWGREAAVAGKGSCSTHYSRSHRTETEGGSK